MKTRDKISDDHDHPDQANYDPYSPGGVLLRALLTPAPQHVAKQEALREAWEPRILDPRTMNRVEPEER